MDNQPPRLFLIWSKSSGHYTSLRSLLDEQGWTVLIIQELASLSKLVGSKENLVCLAILSPSAGLSGRELEHVQEFISQGNLGFIASSAIEDGESLSPSAVINEFSSAFGVIFNEDCVIRPNLYKLYHPQEAMIEDFVANRGLNEVLKRHISQRPSDDSLSKAPDGPIKFGPRILYPSGCTMRVDIKLSTIIMTSSKWALPSGQPIGAIYRNDSSQSRLVMLGSALLMSDQYLDKEDNRCLVNSLLEFLTNKSFPINISDARTIEIAGNNLTADMERLIEEPIGCLRHLDPLPENKAELIDARLFSLDNSQLPNLMKAYRDLGLAYEPLTLMRPVLSWRRNDESNGSDQLKFLLKRIPRTKD